MGVLCARRGARERRGRDLDEPDVEVREEEDRLHVVDEDRPLAVQLAQVRAAQPDVARRGRLEQVGDQRLLAIEMENDLIYADPQTEFRDRHL